MRDDRRFWLWMFALTESEILSRKLMIVEF